MLCWWFSNEVRSFIKYSTLSTLFQCGVQLMFSVFSQKYFRTKTKNRLVSCRNIMKWIWSHTHKTAQKTFSVIISSNESIKSRFLSRFLPEWFCFQPQTQLKTVYFRPAERAARKMSRVSSLLLWWCPLMRSASSSAQHHPVRRTVMLLLLTLRPLHSSTVSYLCIDELQRRQLDRGSIGARGLDADSGGNAFKCHTN